MLVGARLKMAYDIIDKGYDGKSSTDFNEWFTILQKGWQESMLYCQENVLTYAKKIANEGGMKLQLLVKP